MFLDSFVAICDAPIIITNMTTIIALVLTTRIHIFTIILLRIAEEHALLAEQEERERQAAEGKLA